MSKWTMCLKIKFMLFRTTYDERTNCDNGMIMCYNGICVPSIDYCYPIKKCENDYIRCSDGNYRQEKSLCPLSDNCPSIHPY